MMRGQIAAVLLVLSGVQPALACTHARIVPELPAGLSEKDSAAFLAAYYQAWDSPAAQAARLYDHQEEMWREAGSVVLVRIAAFNRLDPDLPPREARKLWALDATAVGVTLEPMRWLKGQGEPAPIRVRHRSGGDCSEAAGWDASSAKVGDTFIAYFKSGPLSDDALLDGLAPEAVVEPNAKALLALHQ